jgi:hypothetical protein
LIDIPGLTADIKTALLKASTNPNPIATEELASDLAQAIGRFALKQQVVLALGVNTTATHFSTTSPLPIPLITFAATTTIT